MAFLRYELASFGSIISIVYQHRLLEEALEWKMKAVIFEHHTAGNIIVGTRKRTV